MIRERRAPHKETVNLHVDAVARKTGYILLIYMCVIRITLISGKPAASTPILTHLINS